MTKRGSQAARARAIESERARASERDTTRRERERVLGFAGGILEEKGMREDLGGGRGVLYKSYPRRFIKTTGDGSKSLVVYENHRKCVCHSRWFSKPSGIVLNPRRFTKLSRIMVYSRQLFKPLGKVHRQYPFFL